MLLALLLMAGTPEAEAADAERAAFNAVREQRWCDALTLFTEAHRLAPVDELLFNAALAAERAGDRARAVALFGQLPPHFDKAASVRRHLDELARTTDADTPCPAPTVAAPTPAEARLASPMLAAPTHAAPTHAATGETATQNAPAPTSEGASTSSGFAFAALGVGSALVVAGAASWALGAATWGRHEEARAAIQAAEADGEAPASVASLQEQQTRARADFESWGGAAVGGGVALVVTGVATAVAAGAWLAVGADP